MNVSLIGRNVSSFLVQFENVGEHPSPALVSFLVGITTCPQPVAVPSFTTFTASLYEEIDAFFLEDSSSKERPWNCVPSTLSALMKEKVDKWLTIKACSLLIVTNFPFVINFNFCKLLCWLLSHQSG